MFTEAMFKKILNLFTDRNFILYVIIGLSGVAIDFVVYFILVKLGLPAVLASAISVSFGIVNNFILNAHFNFRRKDHLWSRFFRFYAVGATGVVLSSLFILLFHDIFGMSAIYAKVISVPFIVLFQYWFNKNSSFALNHKQIPVRQLSLFAVCVAVYCLFAMNAPYFNFTDEADNLLGAQLIANGGVIYRDYFSHHMPLTYFVGAPLFILFGAKLIAIKVAFGLVMATWLLMMSRHLHKKFGLKVFASFTLLVSVSQMLNWSHMILAETLIAFAVCHALILFLTQESGKRSIYLDTLTLAFLGAIPVLSSLSYLPLSLFIYVLLLLIFVRRHSFRRDIFPIVIGIAAALLPFLALTAYLYMTRSFSEMRYQAVTFNKLYYSQYLADAAGSPIDGVLAVIQGSINSFIHSITLSSLSHPQPLSFLFAASLTACVGVLVRLRFYLIAGTFTLALVLSASRAGFSTAFSGDDQARAGLITSVVGLLLLAVTIYYVKKLQVDDWLRKLVTVSICATVTLVVLSSLVMLASTGRGYIKSQSLVASIQEPGSPATVINLVNTTSDYYWLGPIDFSSQLLIKSKNASIYRFYAPWHSVCPSCTKQIEQDLKRNNPKVIAFDDTVSIWGHTPAEYAAPLMASFEQRYYKLEDPRLRYFYFNKASAAQINDTLGKAGYDISSYKK